MKINLGASEPKFFHLDHIQAIQEFIRSDFTLLLHHD